MTEFEYRHDSFAPEETIEIPDGAIGVTVETFGGAELPELVHVRYLVPVNGGGFL